MIFSFNGRKLIGKIAERGESRESTGKAAGMNRDSFSRKVKNGSFTIAEIYYIFEHLGVGKEEAIEILLSKEEDNVDKWIL